MRILVATDARHPQINGVVRTLTSLPRSASTLGADIGGRNLPAQAALNTRGFKRLGTWTRGVDRELFTTNDVFELDWPRPIFMTVGRVAVEKNLRSFPMPGDERRGQG